MWEQAKARAAETGSTVVWCDGGKDGISGIASGVYSEILQVGPGSWTKRFGIHYPFNETRTFYTYGGDWAAFFVVWAIMGVGTSMQLAASLVSFRRLGAFAYVRGIIFRRSSRPRLSVTSEETSLLG